MYYLVLALLWLIAILPNPILYLISKFLYVLMYHVIGYRKAVVRTNLKNAFPNKSPEEITVIAKEFYTNFCEYLLETVKLIHTNESSTRKMVTFSNTELIDELYAQGRGILLLQGHFFNWELALMLGHQGGKYARHVVYQRLTSDLSEKMIYRLRGRYGTKMLAMYETVDHIEKTESPSAGSYVPSMYQFGADQSPMRHKIKYWTTFMNQDSGFFLAPEQLSKQHDLAVVYLDLQKIGRGKYNIEYSLITDNPQATAEYEITEAYIDKLEEAIGKNPSNWLWSHKRWKVRKPD